MIYRLLATNKEIRPRNCVKKPIRDFGQQSLRFMTTPFSKAFVLMPMQHEMAYNDYNVEHSRVWGCELWVIQVLRNIHQRSTADAISFAVRVTCITLFY